MDDKKNLWKSAMKKLSPVRRATKSKESGPSGSSQNLLSPDWESQSNKKLPNKASTLAALSSSLLEKASGKSPKDPGKSRSGGSRLKENVKSAIRKLGPSRPDRESTEQSVAKFTDAHNKKLHDMGARQPSSIAQKSDGKHDPGRRFSEPISGLPPTKTSDMMFQVLPSSTSTGSTSSLGTEKTTVMRGVEAFGKIAMGLSTGIEEQFHKNIMGRRKYLYVFGGGELDLPGRGSMERYHFEDNKWEKLSTRLPHSGIGSGVAWYQDKVWLIGGRPFAGRKATNETYALQNDVNGKWNKQDGKELAKRRMSLGVAVLESKLYACGGKFSDMALNIVEVYDGETWSETAHMQTSRYDFGLAAHERKLIAAGGISDRGFSLRSVEEYCPTIKQWTVSVDLKAPRRSFQLVSVKSLAVSMIFAVGTSNPQEFNGGWIDLPVKDTTSDIRNVDPAAAIHGEYLYILGGTRGKAKSEAVWRYHIRKQIWSECAVMKEARSGCKALLITKNVEDEDESN